MSYWMCISTWPQLTIRQVEMLVRLAEASPEVVQGGTRNTARALEQRRLVQIVEIEDPPPPGGVRPRYRTEASLTRDGLAAADRIRKGIPVYHPAETRPHLVTAHEERVAPRVTPATEG